jgi:hypothetical protein
MIDFDLQQKILEQQRQQAAAQSEFQAPQGQMIGGRYIAPSALQYLAAGLRSIGGLRGQDIAAQGLSDLNTQRSEGTQKAMADFLRQAQGTPANAPSDGVGPTMPAQAPNMQGAYAALLNAPDQNLRQAGMQGTLQFAQQQAQQGERQRMLQMLQNMTPQQAIAAGVPADMVKQYAESQNYGKPKVEYKDVGGSLVPVSEFGGTPAGAAPIPKTGNPFSDLVVAGPNGSVVPNAPLVGVKQGLARAGAPSVNLAVNTEKSLLTTMGEGLGKQLDASLAGAQSAQNTVQVAGKIRDLVNSGKVITGPGADYRVTLARLGEGLGVGGKDNAEKLSNTAQLMQNLAKTELDASQSMRGQGPITDNERALIRRAAAGDMGMTGAELVTLSNAIEKNARARIQQHQTQVKRLQALPGASSLVPFYSVDEPVAQQGGVVDFGSLK